MDGWVGDDGRAHGGARLPQKENWQIRIRVYYRVSVRSPDCSGRGSGTGQGEPSAAFPAWLDAEEEGFMGECLLGHAHRNTKASSGTDSDGDRGDLLPLKSPPQQNRNLRHVPAPSQSLAVTLGSIHCIHRLTFPLAPPMLLVFCSRVTGSANGPSSPAGAESP
ncbi:hypothetical protein EYF80_056512 [Liparis tanakae]|uniref:Uncharacterized protein n=1 Tax=Liparis tanakae TaxID=230148 RepID=A0A4Z2EYA8_9TELE|nr:hypothetical protein EYF80_056512 [Liparis tanakae]